MNYIYINKYKSTKTVFSEIQARTIGKLPIIEINNEFNFVDNVNQIISKKEANEDTTAEEKQIDLMVYKLYELTYDEVKIIEPEFEMSKEEYEKH